MPFSIGFGELVVIGVVALIVIGPKDLPRMFRSVGQFTGRMRAMADDFRRTMESAADEAGVNDLKKQYRDISSLTEEEMGFAETNEALRDLNNTKLDNIQASATSLEADLDLEFETEIEDSDAAIAKSKAAKKTSAKKSSSGPSGSKTKKSK